MSFNRGILSWYSENKRDLPWRNTADPYKIWISEIILQQTRVNQGLGYYNKFVNQYPNIKSLANAKESAVLKLWQGLGYYSRARNMHAAANHIYSNHDGVFPKTYKTVLGLRGVGEYTAAAICSFAYNQVHAVLDGNVYRVLSRYFGIRTPIDTGLGKKEFQKLADKHICHDEPGIYNQAIMEFGALQCTKSPNCNECPIRSGCVAYEIGYVKGLPVKLKKQKKRTRKFNYLVFIDKENTFIEKRTGNDIWKSLYEFPLIESDQNITKQKLFDLLQKKFHINKKTDCKLLSKIKIEHQLTHQKIISTFWKIDISNVTINPTDKKTKQIKTHDINKYPLHRLTEKYLESKCLGSEFYAL